MSYHGISLFFLLFSIIIYIWFYYCLLPIIFFKNEEKNNIFRNQIKRIYGFRNTVWSHNTGIQKEIIHNVNQGNQNSIPSASKIIRNYEKKQIPSAILCRKWPTYVWNHMERNISHIGFEPLVRNEEKIIL
jgi:Zn-finger protein